MKALQGDEGSVVGRMRNDVQGRRDVNSHQCTALAATPRARRSANQDRTASTAGCALRLAANRDAILNKPRDYHQDANNADDT